MQHDAWVTVATDALDADLEALTEQFGFRVDAIFPADAPTTAIVSGHGLRLRLEHAPAAAPIDIDIVDDEPGPAVVLPGGTVVRRRSPLTGYQLPINEPTLVVTSAGGGSGVGRAGMRYRDLLPDRWGGRFISSHITIPDGGPVPDYVHFHHVRFQMIFVQAGWVRLVYEDQGDPFVMHAGDCVLQPPEIRHRVLESSPGLEVIEIGCPAEHYTIADWAMPLPTPQIRRQRDFGGQRFVRHVAADATYGPWRLDGWEHRDTGIGDATDGLAGARVARPNGAPPDQRVIRHDVEFAQLVVVSGQVTFGAGSRSERLTPGAAVTIPGGLAYRLADPTADCELLDVTLPATFETEYVTS